MSQIVSRETGAMRQADPRMTTLQGLSKSTCPFHFSDRFGPSRLKDFLRASWERRAGVLPTIQLPSRLTEKCRGVQKASWRKPPL